MRRDLIKSARTYISRKAMRSDDEQPTAWRSGNHLYGGLDEPELKIIDVFICKIRKKLREATGGQDPIETVWGRGYVLRDPPDMAAVASAA